MLVFAGAGCQSLYFGTLEKFGVHKRDLMVSRVKDARDAQQDAKREFASALEKFKSVVEVKSDGALEAKYARLDNALQRSEARAQEVRNRIGAVEEVAEALFAEWRGELSQYSSAELREASEAQMRESQSRYKKLLAAMKKAEARLEPALQPLRDQVLFLKHNLNAKAIGSLTDELASVQIKVDELVREMESAIREADAFIATLASEKN
jgi:hypothetical protein